MPTDIDFDPTDSDLRVGIELEFPECNDSNEYLSGRGHSSGSLQSEVDRDGLPPSLEARPTYDGTVGLEIVSDTISVSSAANWYHQVVDYMRAEYNAELQPTGLMHGGSTAGLHIHISPLSTEEARDLYAISQTPWAKVLFCSSIATGNGQPTWPVFRGGRYCQMEDNFNDSRYNCINSRGNGHYEWRMPEPMVPKHLEIVERFLALFKEDSGLARDYAQELLDSADDRITSVKRAERIGMDIAGIPSVERSQSPVDPEDFYAQVESAWWLPEIYHVEYEGDNFYLFESQIRDEFSVDGVVFHSDDILWADTLNVVTDPELVENIQRAYEMRNSGSGRHTEATEELKKVIKKKKGAE